MSELKVDGGVYLGWVRGFGTSLEIDSASMQNEV